PTAGLDPKERVKFRNLISELGNDRIVLLSTHIVSDVEHIADVILVMKDGKIIHNGNMEKIIQVIKGKVWECTATDSEVEKLMAEYPVLNIRRDKEGTFLRLVCDQKPLENAVSAEAVLEDLYLYYFSEQEEKIG
ncbi:MAG: ABC transporter ATP-binding protein, partial [Eubacterium sp.]|nr:ABC transporter ATP-binding protein [Eubacterium sp.]